MGRAVGSTREQSKYKVQEEPTELPGGEMQQEPLCSAPGCPSQTNDRAGSTWEENSPLLQLLRGCPSLC